MVELKFEKTSLQRKLFYVQENHAVKEQSRMNLKDRCMVARREYLLDKETCSSMLPGTNAHKRGGATAPAITTTTSSDVTLKAQRLKACRMKCPS